MAPTDEAQEAISPPGKIAYDAYFAKCGGKSLISGAPLPSWEGQAPAIQEAWNAAAQAVRVAVCHIKEFK